jgi:gluconolactonase
MTTGSALFRTLLGQSIAELAKDGHARLLASDLGWGEGPVYIPHHDRWIFSDIPNNRMFAWSERDGLSIFRQPSHYANGNSLARNHDLLTCEHGSRSVTRTSERGITTLCTRFGGGRLNSPNDLVAASDGAIWFTDPSYGILSDVEGTRSDSEQEDCRVYRLEPDTGVLTAEISNLRMPNGLCFSPDERTLYVADSGADMGPNVPFDPDGPKDIFTFAISHGRVDGAGAHFTTVIRGVPDGLRCDEDGFLWAATGAGLECFHCSGMRQGVIATPETASNLCFGGKHGAELLVTLATSAYLLLLEIPT